MDFLSQFELGTSELVIKDHFGKPSGLTLTLQSLQSDDCRKISREIYNENLSMEPADFTAEVVQDRNIRQYSAAIVSWSFDDGTTLEGNANPACTAENKRKILKIDTIFKQVDKKLGREKDFLPRSAGI